MAFAKTVEGVEEGDEMFLASKWEKGVIQGLEDEYSFGGLDAGMAADLGNTLRMMASPAAVESLAENTRAISCGSISDEAVAHFVSELGTHGVELVSKRNKYMVDRIIDLYQRKDTSFHPAFVIGAGHLIGQDSMVQHLRSAGFTVTKM